MSDKNISPVGWYIGSYLLRFIELNDTNNDDIEERFMSWENTIIIKANSMDEAYDKIVANAQLSTDAYEGGPDKVPVQWIFEGITDLLPIYEELEDGSEVMWAEHNPRKLKNLRKRIKNKDELKQ